ncbi:NUDIX hydrolase [Bacillus testis]|uniref:NUDIX hydrolase n=1 Tax=Bacillus testis TaxID=1622072 RepID=UPI00067F2E9B|nr:NUDIX domain-containing protein [Bacillus testis]
MESELLRIFNDQREAIGTGTRADIHRQGLWHETFHCWIIGRIQETDVIYLQIRSQWKKDYKGLLDITAAGHLLANEAPEDGLREVHEELGIDIALDDCIPLGILENVIEGPEFIDKELSHVFLYPCYGEVPHFRLQEEEVAGIVTARFKDFRDLWTGKAETIKVQGFVQQTGGKQTPYASNIGKQDFVQHQPSYYNALIEKTEQFLKSRR